jgi:lysophospholipase L1-like esterase
MAKRIVQRLFLTIILVLVIQIIRVILDKSSPVTILWHQSLLGMVRNLVIIWFLLALVLDIIFRKRTNVKRTGLLAVGIMAAIITIGELFAASWINNPQRIPAWFLTGYRQLYAHHYTNFIQIIPECSEYDSAFFYNLKPDNSCTFSNVEFSNVFTTNKAGMRDDDSSLVAPDIICLGDSYMMGWGVDQHESIPSQLEKMSGKKVLNAGMSSFGTAREIKRLHTLDTSGLQYLVIQYCGNDNEENKAWADNHGILPISSRSSYDSLRDKNEWNKKYFPGKYFTISTTYLLKEKIKAMLGKPPAVIGLQPEYPRDAKNFLDILKTAPVDFSKTKVIVFETMDLAAINDTFINEVNKLLEQPEYKNHFAGNVQTISLAGLLQEEDYYIVDGHLRASGHQKIAAAILKHLN